MQYDSKSNTVFVGDYSGGVNILKYKKDSSTLNELAYVVGHNGSVRSLLWEPSIGMLFSGSFDKKIVMWDIGGGKGEHFDLCAHKGKVKGIVYVAETNQLITAGDDQSLIVWDMSIKRQTPPEWSESPTCESSTCQKPFFFSLSKMWEKKEISMKRQHHCRMCGKAMCDKCTECRSTIPTMGFETKVRVCNDCIPELETLDRTPRAKVFPAGGVIESMRLLRIDKAPVLLSCSSDDSATLWKLDMLSESGASADGFSGVKAPTMAKRVSSKVTGAVRSIGKKDQASVEDENPFASGPAPTGKPLVYNPTGDEDDTGGESLLDMLKNDD